MTPYIAKAGKHHQQQQRARGGVFPRLFYNSKGKSGPAQNNNVVVRPECFNSVFANGYASPRMTTAAAGMADGNMDRRHSLGSGSPHSNGVKSRLDNYGDAEGMEEGEEEEEEDLWGLFHKFCSTCTIHGTYYWMESKSVMGKLFWMTMVVMGVLMAGFIIRSSFAGWKDNPVITSVMQKSIEEIPFPAITICPTDETRYGTRTPIY